MTFASTLALYGITLVVFFVVDMVWLGVVAREFYRTHLGSLLNPDVNWTAAILFYLLFIAGLLVFAIRPALAGGGALAALLLGAFFGLVSYATYDLTNLATLKNWPLVVTVVDLAWGTCLGGIVSWLSVLAARAILRL